MIEKEMKSVLNLNLISKYRAQIMGFAIILIMYTHNSMVLPGRFGQINRGLRMLAQSGVDMFFFLSGFGCFYSLQSKGPNKFYIKRFTRIFYSYITVFVMYGLFRVGMRGESFEVYLSKFGLHSFFTKGELSEWFIAAILVTYLVTPLFYKLLKNKEKGFLVLILAVYSFIIFSRVFLGDNVIVKIWFTRLPAYLFGMVIAKIVVEKSISLIGKQVLFIIFISVICGALTLVFYMLKIPSYWLINRLLFLPIIVGLILTLVLFFEKAEGDLAHNILKWLGNITLEIYLVHEKILGMCNGFFGRIEFNESAKSIILNVLAIIIAVCLAKTLNILTDKIKKV